MRESLESKGWKMYYECNTCSGVRQYYSHTEKPGWEVRVRVRSNTFSLFLNNHKVSGPHYGYMLEEQLQKNGI